MNASLNGVVLDGTGSTAVQTAQQLSLPQGESFVVTVDITGQDGTAFVLDGYTSVLTVRRSVLDSQPLFARAGVNSVTPGRITFTGTKVDTIDAIPRDYAYDVWITELATAKSYRVVPESICEIDYAVTDLDGAITPAAGSVFLVGYPDQATHANQFLKTDGTSPSWASVDTLPSQTGNSGKFLTTDGSASSWATVDAFPTQTGNTGKVLTTDGSAVSWGPNSVTVTAGTGLTGGGAVALGASVSLSIPTSGVSAGTYNNVTVNDRGIATAGSNVAYLTQAYTTVKSSSTTLTQRSNLKFGADFAVSDATPDTVVALAANSLTVTASTGLSGGGSVSLGSSVSLSVTTPIPSQTSNSGKFLTTDGTTPSWVNIPVGTVIGSSTAKSILYIDASNQLAQDSSNLTWDDTNKRLGIGSNTPAYFLDIKGSATGSAAARIWNTNTGGNSSIRFDDDGGTGKFSFGYGNSASTIDTQLRSKAYLYTLVDFGIYRGSSSWALYHDFTNNRVGIGTASPASFFHVAGTSQLQSVIFTTDNTYSIGSTSVRGANIYSKIHTAYLTAADAVRNTVTDGAVLQNANTSNINVTGDDGQAYSPALHFIGTGWKTTGSANVTVDARIFARPVQGTSNPRVQIAWQSQIAAGGYTELMTLDSAGFLGVGTTSPSYKIVAGTDVGAGLTNAVGTFSKGSATSVSCYIGADTSNGLDLGWDNTNSRAYFNTNSKQFAFTHGATLRTQWDTNGNLLPGATNSYSLGNISTPLYWKAIYAQQHIGLRQTPTIASSITVDPTAGELVSLALTATSISTMTISAGQSAQLLTVEVVQDATGGRQTPPSTWTNVLFAGGAAPTWTTTASKRDTVTFRYNATSSKWIELSRSLALA